MESHNQKVFFLKTLYKIIRFTFSFEFIFTAFLFAGRYKADSRFSSFPVDITAFLFVISVIQGLVILSSRKIKVNINTISVCLLGVIFAGYVAMSLLWTPSVNYAYEKTLYIATLVLWSLIGTALIISRERSRVIRLLIAIVIFSFWFASESAIFYIKHNMSSTFINALGIRGAYLGLGRVIGAGAVVILSYAVLLAKTSYARLFSLIIGIFFVFVLLILGGRGPFIATLSPFLIALLFTKVHYNYKSTIRIKSWQLFTAIFLVTVLFLCAFTFYFGYNVITLQRLQLLFSQGMGKSASLRADFYVSSIQRWLDSPIWGHGIGSWPTLMLGMDERGYPHNIIMEILVELGLIGMLIFGFLICRTFFNIGKLAFNKEDKLALIIFILFCNVLFNAMISGDISDNRILFVVVGLAAYRGLYAKRI